MMRTKERWVRVLQKQSSSAAVIFTPSLCSPRWSHSSLLSSLISLSSPQTITMLTRSLTTRKPGNAAAPSHSGKLASWHLTNCSTYRWRRTLQVLEFLRSRTDLRGQRWSPVSTCTQHVTHTSHVSRGDKAVVTGHQESPEAAS